MTFQNITALIVFPELVFSARDTSALLNTNEKVT